MLELVQRLLGKTGTQRRSVAGGRDGPRKLESTGYQVQRVKAEHGAYKVGALNDSGFPIYGHLRRQERRTHSGRSQVMAPDYNRAWAWLTHVKAPPRHKY